MVLLFLGVSNNLHRKKYILLCAIAAAFYDTNIFRTDNA